MMLPQLDGDVATIEDDDLDPDKPVSNGSWYDHPTTRGDNFVRGDGKNPLVEIVGRLQTSEDERLAQRLLNCRPTADSRFALVWRRIREFRESGSKNLAPVFDKPLSPPVFVRKGRVLNPEFSESKPAEPTEADRFILLLTSSASLHHAAERWGTNLGGLRVAASQFGRPAMEKYIALANHVAV